MKWNTAEHAFIGEDNYTLAILYTHMAYIPNHIPVYWLKAEIFLLWATYVYPTKAYYCHDIIIKNILTTMW